MAMHIRTLWYSDKYQDREVHSLWSAVRASCVKAYPGQVPRVQPSRRNAPKSVPLSPSHDHTTTTTVPNMSQYDAEPNPAAGHAGREAFAAELAPFVPTTDQSGGRNTPAHSGAGQPNGSNAASSANAGSLDAKAGSTG